MTPTFRNSKSLLILGAFKIVFNGMLLYNSERVSVENSYIQDANVHQPVSFFQVVVHIALNKCLYSRGAKKGFFQGLIFCRDLVTSAAKTTVHRTDQW